MKTLFRILTLIHTERDGQNFEEPAVAIDAVLVFLVRYKVFLELG